VEQFKIDNFIRANPGSTPPRFVAVTEAHAKELVDRLLAKAGRPSGTPAEILQQLSAQSKRLADVDVEEDEIPLVTLFEKAGIVPMPFVYVEWGALQDLDRFKLEDLSEHLYDVWYPSADDIEIFDDTLDWIMFVRHYGGIEIWHPST
jgi:hypothetical protein